MVGSDHDPLTSAHVIQPALVAPGKETFPLPIELDTAKMQHGFGSLRYPAHATTVEPFPHHIAGGALDDTRRDHQISFDQVLLGHHGQTLFQRADEVAEAFSFGGIALRSGR